MGEREKVEVTRVVVLVDELSVLCYARFCGRGCNKTWQMGLNSSARLKTAPFMSKCAVYGYSNKLLEVVLS